MNSCLSPEQILQLAPLDLRTSGHHRYTADDERQSLQNFSKEDSLILAKTYASLLDLFLGLRPELLERERSPHLIKDFVQSGKLADLTSKIQSLGRAAPPDGARASVSRAIHDLRGGALQALICRLGFLEDTVGVDEWNSVYFLLRDHLKIMRNCVADLDPGRFAEDRAQKNHDAQLLVEKWTKTDFYGASTPVAVAFDCRYRGHLCESCLEFSTLDRIIYNLMNNAAKYTADGVISFFVIAVPELSPKSVRFVVSNAVTDEQRTLLNDRFSHDLSEIYRGGFTTGGHGLGLRIAADFCCSAYGLSDFQRGQDERYFGATLLANQFVAWFHWPIEE